MPLRRRRLSGHRPAVPPHVLNLLALDASTASELAAVGQSRNGYRCLLAGWRLARELCDAGEPWAAELARRYRSVLNRYGARFGHAPSERQRYP